MVDKQVEGLHLKVCDFHDKGLHFRYVVLRVALERLLFIDLSELSAKCIEVAFGVFRLFMFLTFLSDFLERPNFRYGTF
jgi:hypothetical protein